MRAARRPHRPRSDRQRRWEERECATRRRADVTCYAAERPCRKARTTPMAASIVGHRVDSERKEIGACHPTLARVVELDARPDAFASNDSTNLTGFGVAENF